MNIKLLFASVLAVGIFACNQPASEHEGEEEQNTETTAEVEEPKGEVFFENLNDGDTVSSPFVVQMGVKNLTVEAANGDENPGHGHHHIIINGSSLSKGTIVPKDETHIHYGSGQTTDTLELDPGQYTLTLQFADGVHQSFGEELSNTISITVE